MADTKDCLPNCTCLQYPNDSNIYQYWKVKDLKTCCINVQNDLSRLLNSFTYTNLVFNATKTKLMLLITVQIKACHKLDKINDLKIKCMEKQFEWVNEWKLLSVIIDQLLHWKFNINKIAEECCTALSVLKLKCSKIKMVADGRKNWTFNIDIFVQSFT